MIVFLWDIDGTLLLSGGAGKMAFDEIFLKLFGEEYIWQNIKPDGRTDPAIIDQLFYQRFNRNPTHEERTRIVEHYNDAMQTTIPKASRFRLMPQAKQTLEFLSQHNHVHLGLATGNFETTAWHKLKFADLDSYFHFGGFGSDADDRLGLTQIALDRAKDHIGGEPSEVYVVGDTIYDVRCGRAIGAKTIAVCTGSTTAEELKSEGASWVIPDLSQFQSLPLI